MLNPIQNHDLNLENYKKRSHIKKQNVQFSGILLIDWWTLAGDLFIKKSKKLKKKKSNPLTSFFLRFISVLLIHYSGDFICHLFAIQIRNDWRRECLLVAGFFIVKFFDVWNAKFIWVFWKQMIVIFAKCLDCKVWWILYLLFVTW